MPKWRNLHNSTNFCSYTGTELIQLIFHAHTVGVSLLWLKRPFPSQHIPPYTPISCFTLEHTAQLRSPLSLWNLWVRSHRSKDYIFLFFVHTETCWWQSLRWQKSFVSVLWDSWPSWDKMLREHFHSFIKALSTARYQACTVQATENPTKKAQCSLAAL